MINANEFGLSVKNDGNENARILNSLLSEHSEIEVSEKGEYIFSDTIIVGSNTTLRFGEGVFIKREENEKQTGYVLVNKGAYTREYDENISIIGLNLICNNVTCAQPLPENDKIIPGLRSHIAFFYVKNLLIKDFTSFDLPSKDFGIQICTFKNIKVENVKIEGQKDAVHLGRGSGFVIKDGFFKTYDDPIALNAHDYSTSNPQLGWIENGIIENCYDYNDESTDGFFCRILAGSWTDWYEGMEVQRSDTVIFNNKMYRVIMDPDGKTYISHTPPTHKKGSAVLDGIRWEFIQDEICYNCGCRNIRFKDIYIEKNRPVAFSIHHDRDKWSRSVYPGSFPPVQSGIIFDNVNISGNVPVFLSAASPLSDFSILNSNLNNAKISLTEIDEIIGYPDADFSFKNTVVPDTVCSPKRQIIIKE